MEQKNITLQYGIHRTPSLGPDGELSEAVNLIPQNGELVNIQEPMYINTASQPDVTGGVLKNIHDYEDGRLYFIYYSEDGTVRYTINSDGVWDSFQDASILGDGDLPTLTEDVQVICYGNIVILIDEHVPYYFIFKDDSFEYLGNEIPRLNLSFGLKCVEADPMSEDDDGDSFSIDRTYNGTSYQASYFGIVYPESETGSIEVSGDGTIATSVTGVDGLNPRERVTEGVLAAVNYFLDRAYRKGYFVEPFLVRYAYRLYDGTTVMSSAPVLMVPSTRPVPEVIPTGVGNDEGIIPFSLYGARCVLDYGEESGLDEDTVSKWSDIIKSVDIFVSAPFRQYKQSENVEQTEELAFGITRGFYMIPSASGDVQADGLYRERITHTTSTVQYVLPTYSDETFNDNVRDCSTFYLIKSIPFTDFGQGSTERVVIDTDGVLEALTSRETLSDVYLESGTIVPQKTLVYNNRLHMHDVFRFIPEYYETTALFPYTNGEMIDLNETYIGDNETPSYVLPVFQVAKNGKTYYVANTDGATSTHYPYGSFYLFYPDVDVEYVSVRWDYNDDIRETIHKMNRHNYLNGSVYFEGFGDLYWQGHICDDYHTPQINDITDGVMDSLDCYTTNKTSIFVSSESNPFLIETSSVVTLPSNILALSTAAKALSQGQFGEFPLYVFCSDGIWALSVSSDGDYAAKQPVSRDVCTRPESITQIDNAVVFVTNQGLKLIQGSDVVLLSGDVDGLNVAESFIESAVDTFATSKAQVTTPYVLDESQFIDQLNADTTQIVYDYPHQLLHIFYEQDGSSEGYYKHYVYSLESKQWATQVLSSQLTTVVPGYPLSTMQFGTSLYQYDKDTSSTQRIGYVLTRPLSLDDPLARKALYDLRVVGQRTSQNTLRRVAVYVSNDNYNWVRLSSLKALSAKYYRFLVMSYMYDIDTISGLALQYDKRFTHKMRGH